MLHIAARHIETTSVLILESTPELTSTSSPDRVDTMLALWNEARSVP